MPIKLCIPGFHIIDSGCGFCAAIPGAYTVYYTVYDRDTIKRKDIEALPDEEKEKVYYFTHRKAKKAFAK